jgi:hypothetical protein
MPCSFGLVPHRRSGTGGQPNGFLQVTVADRYIPLVTPAYGRWVARPARTTIVRTWRRRSSSARRVRPVLGDYRLVGKSPEGLRQPGGRLELRPASSSGADSGSPPAMTCASSLAVVTTDNIYWPDPRRWYYGVFTATAAIWSFFTCII